MKLGTLAGSETALSPGASDIEITGLTADSRAVEPGFLFAALPGVQADGAKFIPSALEKGAAAILISQGIAASLDVSVPVIEDADPRRRLALMAASFSAEQPETIVAVTGTNGKTSVASFLRQIWAKLGHRSASLGTVGIQTEGGDCEATHITLTHTTPEPVELHKLLAELAKDGTTHLALEASSHGLQQRRLDAVTLSASAFTNISRDHLDYHADFEDYLSQKLRLFSVLSYKPGAKCIVEADCAGAERAIQAIKARGLTPFTVGRKGSAIKLLDAEQQGHAQKLTLEHDGNNYDVLLPLLGDFQVSNALVAAGLAIATGHAPEAVFPCLENLQGAKGRLEHVGTTSTGAPIFIDYAHTPDALTNALSALRPYASSRLAIVFGCGGDRDKGKRPQMGKAATEAADLVIVTDDNPRGEDPATIRAEIMTQAPGAREIGDRKQAITEAIAQLNEGDLLLVAGKGHETGQIIGQKIIPFSDHEAVEHALKEAIE